MSEPRAVTTGSRLARLNHHGIRQGTNLRPQDIIRKKRDREELLPAEINFFIDGVTHDQIADYQISALLMAIYLNGMNDAEQQCLTEAMLQSGSILDFSSIA